METVVDEIAPDIFRLSTFVPEVTPAGFTFNQFLIRAEEPMLFHCGMRGLFPAVSAALGRVMPVEALRWIAFGHIEADECGAMNAWLAASPRAEVVHGQLACDLSVRDMADRPPRALADDEVLDLGGRRMRFLATPHVPHAWEAGLYFEEESRTLFCGDLFAQVGPAPALTHDDIVAPAVAAEGAFHAMTMAPNTGEVLERLAGLEPTTLALMHGPSFSGDGAKALRDLAAALGVR
jgi:flavorubredoxin